MKKDLVSVINVLKKAGKTKITDWIYTEGFLIRHRIENVFYNNINSVEDIPKEFLRKSNETKIVHIKRAYEMRETVLRLNKLFSKNKISYAFLKGSVFVCRPYPFDIYEIGERVSNDIDILVSPDDLGKVEAVLKSEGYIQGYFDNKTKKIISLSRAEILSRRMNRGETAPFVKYCDNDFAPISEIDINFSLKESPHKEDKLLEKMLNTTRDYVTECGDTIKTLSPECFLLHLILHQYKESTVFSMVKRGKDFEIYKFLDIFRLMSDNRINLSKFVDLIKYGDRAIEACTVLNQVGILFQDEKIMRVIKDYDLFNKQYSETVYDPIEKAFYQWTIPFCKRINKNNRIKFLKINKEKN